MWVSVWVHGSGCRRGVWARGCVGVWFFFCVSCVFVFFFLKKISLFFKSLKSLGGLGGLGEVCFPTPLAEFLVFSF